MNVRHYLSAMGFGALLSWIAVAVVFILVGQPEASLALVFFVYGAIFLGSLGTFAVGGFLIRATILHGKFMVGPQVAISFRQATLLAILTIIILFLSSHGYLKWWAVLSVIVVLTALEGMFLSFRIKKVD